MLQLGSIIDGKYKILDVIGQGGMSTVYLAINEKANKPWAIKEIQKVHKIGVNEITQSLMAEVNLLKGLKHSGLPSIVDIIEYKQSFLIVMDYIEGNPLSKILKEHGARPQEQVIRWAIQLCDVLEYLHNQDPPVIYRDMKPSNIMGTPDGGAVLIDFGTARTFKDDNLEDTVCLGTRGYAAPEQYKGHGQTDVRTDIYGLGAVLYHLLTGHNPGEPPYAIYPIRKWKPELSSGLEDIILTCTRENPKDRYQTCAELKYALENYRKLDKENRCRQQKKWNLFLWAASLSLVMAAGAVGFYVAEKKVLKNSYDQYLLDAKFAKEKEEQYECYKKAIDLRPERGEAYIEVLERNFLEDQIFTREEDQKLREILGVAYGKNKSNESYLKKNKEAYEAFAYRAAIAYFYYFYEEEEGKNSALKWLEIVKDASTLEKQKRERGKYLGKIAEYYSSIGIWKLEGDLCVTYLEYWNDMADVLDGNLAETDNVRTALVMYGEFVAQSINHCNKFKNAGVKKADIFHQIENIIKRLETDIIIHQEENQNLETEKREILENIESLKKLIDSVYQ